MGSAPTLQYPDLPARWGIAVDEDRYRFRLVVPPVPGWRHLPSGYRTAVLMLGTMALFWLSTGIPDRKWKWDELRHPLIHVGIGFVVVLAMSWFRLRRWIVFEVTADQFQMIPHRSFGGATQAQWPRADVLEVRLNEFNGKMILRLRGQDTLELFVSSNKEVAGYVVRKLADALQRSFAREAVGPRLAVAPPMTGPPAKLSKGFGAGIVAVISALVVAYNVWPFVVEIVLAVTILAAIPLGIRLGTQKKDYWL